MGECFFWYRLTRVVLDKSRKTVVVVVVVVVVVTAATRVWCHTYDIFIHCSKFAACRRSSQSYLYVAWDHGFNRYRS